MNYDFNDLNNELREIIKERLLQKFQLIAADRHNTQYWEDIRELLKLWDNLPKGRRES